MVFGGGDMEYGVSGNGDDSGGGCDGVHYFFLSLSIFLLSLFPFIFCPRFPFSCFVGVFLLVQL